MAEEVDIKLLIDTAGSASSVSEVRKAIKDLKSAMNEVGTGSAEFNKLAAAAGDLKEKMDLTNKSVAALAGNGAKFTALAGGARQIASGFEGAAAASALFGDKNEDLEKSLLKVQAAASLTRAVSELSELGKTAQVVATVMKAAFATNPLGVILLAITAAVAGIALLIKSFDSEKEASEKLTKALEKQKAALENLMEVNEADTSFLKSRLALMKQQKKSAVEIEATEQQIYKQERETLDQKKQAIEINRKIAIEDAKFGKNKISDEKELQAKIVQINSKSEADLSVISNNIAALSDDRQTDILKTEQEIADQEKKTRDEAAKKYEEYIRKGLDQLTKSEDNKVLLTKEGSQERLDAESASLDAQLLYAKKNAAALHLTKTDLLNQELKSSETSYNAQVAFDKKIQDAKIKAEADAKQRLKERTDAGFKAEEESVKLALKTSEQKIKIDGDNLNRYKQTIVAKIAILKQTDIDELALIGAQTQQKELLAKKEAANRIIEAGDDANAIAKINQDLANQLVDIHSQSEDQILAKEQKTQGEILKLKYEAANKNLGVATQLTDGLSSLSDSVYENEIVNAHGNEKAILEIKKRQFATEKAFNITKAIIGGIQSVVQALADNPPPLSYALAAINGALAVANIVKISQSKFDPGTSGSGASATIVKPSIPSVSLPSNLSSVTPAAGGGAAGFQPSNLFGLGNGAKAFGAGQGQQQVVVSIHDINRNQNKVQVINNRGTLK